MAPLRGWGPKGQRIRAFAPHGHWRTLTFLGALRHDRFAAPCVFDGPINGQSFRAYVEQLLVPTLKPGDIVIMDNLGSHKSLAIAQMIRSAGARLRYLPPYSPELNPDELVWNDVKNNGVARTLIAKPADLKNAVIGRLRYLQETPAHVRSFFQAPETKYAA